MTSPHLAVLDQRYVRPNRLRYADGGCSGIIPGTKLGADAAPAEFRKDEHGVLEDRDGVELTELGADAASGAMFFRDLRSSHGCRDIPGDPWLEEEMGVRFFNIAVEELDVRAGLLEDIRDIDGHGCFSRAAFAACKGIFADFSSSSRRVPDLCRRRSQPCKSLFRVRISSSRDH